MGHTSGSMQCKVFGEETRAILRLAVPRMIQMWFNCMADRVTLGFVGNYDPSEAHIAAAAFGKVWSNVTGLSVGIGVALGISYFASQNHGRKASEENGIVFRHCCLGFVFSVAFAFICAIFSPQLLRAAGQPEDLLGLIQTFALIQVLGLPAAFLKEALTNSLNAQCIVLPGMWSDGIACLSNCVSAYMLITSGLGYLGSAWAFVLSQHVGCSLLLSYVIWQRLGSKVWKIPDQVSSLGRVSWWRYNRAMLPSAFTLWSEWWAAEVLSLLAGVLPGKDASVGAQGILMNTNVIFYMTFLGVQTATTTRVGNLVGMKEEARLPLSIASALAIAAVLSGASSLLLQVFGHSIMRLWTDDEGILAEADGALLGPALSVPPYAIMKCLIGVLLGAGLQMRGVIIVACSFYFAGLPLSAYLSLAAGCGLMGVWWGNVLGLSLSAAGMGVQVCFIRWKEVLSSIAKEGELREGLEEPMLKKTNALGGA